MINTRIIAFLMVITLVSLTACSEDSVQPATPIEGQWGADHIVVVIGAAGGALEFDCAFGTIDEPVVLNTTGHFDVLGTYTREPGGPVTRGQEPPIQPARYKGVLVGNTLIVTVTLTDSGDVLGSYTLVRDALGRLFKCV